MADKNAVSDWDVVPTNNDNIAGVPLSEGVTLPSHLNNAIRVLMAQIAALKPVGYSAQTRSDTEQRQARSNIGAQAVPTVSAAAPSGGQDGDVWYQI